MIDGSVHAGPNAVLSLKREGYRRTSFDLRDFMDTMTYAGFWRLAAKYAQIGTRRNAPIVQQESLRSQLATVDT